jgi:uncharacterized protein involved in exopolysaccharide biosynthesis
MERMTTATTPPPNDEVSLRELYLIVRRNALGIVAFVSLVAIVVAAVVVTRPAVYRAEATTAVARAPITVEQEFGLAFRPELDVTFEAYHTLAFSRGVLERVIAAVPDADLTLTEARAAFSLERLAGTLAEPSILLAVSHQVMNGQAEQAAELATVWADATLETIRALLNENLEAIDRITSEELAAAGAALERAEEAFRALHEAQDGLADPQRRTHLQVRLSELEWRGDEVTRLISGREAEAASLSERLGDGGDELVVLSDAREVALTVAGAVWAIEAQLASLRAERDTIERQRAALQEELAALVPNVARFQIESQIRGRAVVQAERAFDTLADIGPTVAYAAQVAPTGARILSEAAVPTAPEGRRTGVMAALAAVVAAFAAIVFVLLREAVRAPMPAPVPAQPSRPARG